MPKDREFRRRSPGIIARLMGMEELPLHLLANTQQRELLESYKQRTESLGPLRKSTSFESSCSCRKKSREEPKFKDVFEVVETKKSRANSAVNEGNIALFREKVADAKRFSTDEMVQSSKESSETLDMFEVNKDLFLRCLQDPNSLYGKHLSELKMRQRESRCRHAVAKSISEVKKCVKHDIGFGSDVDASSKNGIASPEKYNGSSLLYPPHGGVNKARKSSALRSGSKDNKTTIPTRIVVLKPNLEMAQSVSKSFSSPPSFNTVPSSGSFLTELPNDTGMNANLPRKKNVSMDDEISIQKSEESRKIAKKVTRRMKNSLHTNSLHLCHTEFIRYAGDESSSYAHGNDSATESDVTTLASRQSFHRNERRKTSSHSSYVSPVNKEAKKRLSEQWKMSHQFEEAGLVGSRSTLGEVLALSDRKEKTTMLDMIIDQTRSSNRYIGIKGSADRACSVGINSKEGWKDIKTISKSRSLPASSSSFEGPKAGMHRVTHRAERYLMPKEAINLGRNTVVRKNSNRKEGFVTCTSGPNARKSKRCLGTDSEDRDRTREIHFSKNGLKISLEEDDAFEENQIADTSNYSMTDNNLVVDEVVVEHENLAYCSEFPAHMVTEMSDSISVRNGSSTPPVLGCSSPKVTCGPSEEGLVSFCHAVHEPESPAHSKGADVEPDQPSPASVLEAPFLDDLSFGSECFGSLSADLQGLRMQLQLLKFESEEYEEGMVTSSSGDDGEEEEDTTEKVYYQRETFSIEKNCESSYIDEVLTYSGFDNADPDTFITCPVDHSVFLKLEKTYRDQTKWLRSERRLLFDRINTGITEILKQSTQPHPCVNPMESRVSPERTKDMLHKLLGIQEKKASNENTAEKVIEREVRWLDLEGDVDVIGRDVEKALIDELVVEFVTV